MNDARLQSLYRRMTSADARALDADDILDAMSRSGYPDEECTPLDRIAGSAVQADVLRAALALDADAKALSREIAALRAPRREQPVRRWFALAAGMGAAAVLVTGLRLGDAPQAPDAHEAVVVEQAIESDALLSASSFEASDTGASPAPLFSGGFDS